MLQFLTPTISEEKICQEALESGDRWIIIGALLAANPEFLVKNRSPLQTQDKFADSLVQDVVGYLAEPLTSREPWTDFFINRVLFLKTVPLFSHLFLDELLLIHRVLTVEEFPAGRKICLPGQILSKMYIIYQGSVLSIADSRPVSGATAPLKAGKYIGEMALLEVGGT